ncbi:DUF1326 domain-containing protein [Sphingomonas sp. T9W2]|uniref:DUF1326 domain-containing protein n=1 Tax=Sphingomonas sp. T9W2 TaxID=3143183 RepID=UPI0031F55797
MSYKLTGDFVECCDCFTVCPCWVNDVPDEDHCSGLYLWSFAAGSQIDDIPVGGMHVAAAAFHAVRSRGQAIFFIDARKNAAAFEALRTVFSGLDALGKLLGDILDVREATITSTFDQKDFVVEVTVEKRRIAKAEGEDKKFAEAAAPMTLRNAALTDELGIGSGEVRVQTMGDLTVDVAALPGGPLYLRGRSGMRGKFCYELASSDSKDKPQAVPASV